MSELAANFVAVIPMAVAVYFVNDMMQLFSMIKLIVASIMGGGIYWLTCRLLCAELLNECLNMARVRKRSVQI